MTASDCFRLLRIPPGFPGASGKEGEDGGEAEGEDPSASLAASAKFAWRTPPPEHVQFEGAQATLDGRSGGRTAVFGKQVMRSGVWTWTVVIVSSRDNDGEGMLIGIANADKAEYGRNGEYVLLHHYNDGDVEIKAAGKSNHDRSRLEGGEPGRLHNGSSVTVTLDLNKKTLSWATDGGKQQEVRNKDKLQLPKAVVLMCCLNYSEDAVKVEKVKGGTMVPIDRWVTDKHMLGRCLTLSQLPGDGAGTPAEASVLQRGGAALLLPGRASGAGAMRVKAINAQPQERGTRVSTEVLQVSMAKRMVERGPLRSLEGALRAVEAGEVLDEDGTPAVPELDEDEDEDDGANKIVQALLRLDRGAATDGNRLAMRGSLIDTSDVELEEEALENEVAVRPLATHGDHLQVRQIALQIALEIASESFWLLLIAFDCDHSQVEVCAEWCGLRHVYVLRRIETPHARDDEETRLTEVLRGLAASGVMSGGTWLVELDADGNPLVAAAHLCAAKLEAVFDAYVAQAVAEGKLSEAAADALTDEVAKGVDSAARCAIMRRRMAAVPRPLNFEIESDEVDVLGQVHEQMVQIGQWLTAQVRATKRRIRLLEAAKARFDAAEKRRHEEMKSESMEQYMPPRILQGLLPATLLEAYDFYEDCSQLGVFHGYPQVRRLLPNASETFRMLPNASGCRVVLIAFACFRSQRPVSFKEPDEKTADEVIRRDSNSRGASSTLGGFAARSTLLYLKIRITSTFADAGREVARRGRGPPLPTAAAEARGVRQHHRGAACRAGRRPPGARVVQRHQGFCRRPPAAHGGDPGQA